LKSEGPYHDWLMEILRRLPTAGLIKREGPLSRLKKRFRDVYYCYDERYGSVAVNVVNDNHVNLFGPTLASSVSRLHHGGITLSQCYPSRQLSAL
jgi:hypothetical protein